MPAMSPTAQLFLRTRFCFRDPFEIWTALTLILVDGEDARRSIDSLSSRRFTTTDGYGNLTDTHVFHAHRGIPFEHLLIGVFRLILRRIPIEGVEHASLRTLLAIYGKHVMNRAGDGRSDQRNTLQSLVQVVEERDRNFQNAVQVLGLHFVSVATPEIAEAVPLVISAVEPDYEQSAWLQIFGERFDGSFTIRRVMENTDAVDDIETFGREGQGEDIGLECDKVTVGQIFGGHFSSGAQVNSDDARAPAGCDFGEATHAATDVEDKFAFEIFGPERGLCQEMALGFAELIVVELCLLITVPLKTKTGGVVLGINKASYPLRVGIGTLTSRAEVASILVAIKFRSATQAT